MINSPCHSIGNPEPCSTCGFESEKGDSHLRRSEMKTGKYSNLFLLSYAPTKYGPCITIVSEKEAIRIEKAKAKAFGYTYPNDDEAYLDYKAINWAIAIFLPVLKPKASTETKKELNKGEIK